jgi:hypothetical protein
MSRQKQYMHCHCQPSRKVASGTAGEAGEAVVEEALEDDEDEAGDGRCGAATASWMTDDPAAALEASSAVPT